MNKLARAGAAERADLFTETANRLDIAESLIEKDFWVCWTLKQLFSIDQFAGRLLFKGGTSLSKIFGAINRFSEDIDLAVDYVQLGYTGERDPTREDLSKTKRAQLLSEMLLSCQRYIATEFQAALRNRFAEALGTTEGWTLVVDAQDPNTLRFGYPCGIRQLADYVAPQVVLELGTHAELIPRANFQIRPFAATEFPHLFEDPDISLSALLAKRTFWEKATILHAEHHRPREKPTPGRYSRHYYDMAMLLQSPIKKEALADLELLAQVVRHKTSFYPSAWARYDTAKPGSLRLIPHQERIPALKEDYRRMAVMIFGTPPSFESLFDILAAFEREINSR